jgi:hypothetical protein
LLNNYFEPSQYYRKRCFLNRDIVEILSRKELLRLERWRKANRQKKATDINQTKYCDKAVEDETIKKKRKVTGAATAGQRCLCFDRFQCAQSDRPPCSGLQRQQLGMEETGRTGIQPAPLLLVLCPEPCDTVLLL